MKYLGVDFGMRKIGFALSEGEIASPLYVIHIKSNQEGMSRILEIVRQEGIDQIVIGVPEGGIRAAILKIASILKLKIPITLVEETLTTHNAKKNMINLGIKREKRKEEDAYSASIILQEYLDNK